MNYKSSKPIAMPSPNQPPFVRFCALPVATLLALTVSACAAGPTAATTTTPVTHNCKPQETVGFSCELRDHRLLSLCASPGFEKFKGLPKDNPGHAYLAVGTQKGEVQYSYPPNPRDYKKHFYTGVPTNGIPYMFVASEKGRFFFLTEQDDTNPQGAGYLAPENLPDGWDITQKDSTPPCQRTLHFENFSKLGLTHATVWFSEQDRLDAEKTRTKKP